MQRIVTVSLLLVLILNLCTCAAAAEQTENAAAQAVLTASNTLPETASAALSSVTAETTSDAALSNLVRGLYLALGGATLLAALVVVHMTRQLRKDS
ncbi:MAG: hypothetical protein ACI4MJ_01895 [Aristaeellaceae bacterium]